MVKIIVKQYWETTPYPAHNAYKVHVYCDIPIESDGKFPSIGMACDSKKETIAYIYGIQHTFRLYNEVCEVEYIDLEGVRGNYGEVFLLEHEHYSYN